MHGANSYDPDTAQVYATCIKRAATLIEDAIRGSTARSGVGEAALTDIERYVSLLRQEFARR